MNSQPNPAATHARRTWWPSAATCAFLASGQEIFSFVLVQWQRGMIESARSRQSLETVYESAIVGYLFLFLLVFGVAVEARALWGVGRRQRSVAPLSSRWGQWAVATYVVASALTFVPIVLMDMGVFVVSQTVSDHAGLFLATNRWVFQVPMMPLTLAFGCLGWASRGASGPRGRWAARGMLALAAWATFRMMWTMFGLPAGPEWLWLAIGAVTLRAATWIAVGAWLRSTTIAPRPSDPLDGFADRH
jgi:hypothetical protein